MNKESILIIGASSAIGCEIIRQIASDDTIILAHYFSGRARLSKLESEIAARLVPLHADLSSEEEIKSLVERVALDFGFPNKIVFLAAPRITLSRFKDHTWRTFSHDSEMQLRTAFIVLNRFLPKMAAEKNGKVVFMLSSYTIGLPPGAMAHYVTAKYALLGFMRALASEYAPKRICINAVSPSMTDTPFLSGIPEKLIELTAQQHPLKRNATPADVAPVVTFLLSDQAAFMTGLNIPVTFGLQV